MPFWNGSLIFFLPAAERKEFQNRCFPVNSAKHSSRGYNCNVLHVVLNVYKVTFTVVSCRTSGVFFASFEEVQYNILLFLIYLWFQVCLLD